MYKNECEKNNFTVYQQNFRSTYATNGFFGLCVIY